MMSQAGHSGLKRTIAGHELINLGRTFFHLQGPGLLNNLESETSNGRPFMLIKGTNSNFKNIECKMLPSCIWKCVEKDHSKVMPFCKTTQTQEINECIIK